VEQVGRDESELQVQVQDRDLYLLPGRVVLAQTGFCQVSELWLSLQEDFLFLSTEYFMGLKGSGVGKELRTLPVFLH